MKATALIFFLAAVACPLRAQSPRPAWDAVPAPVIAEVAPKPSDMTKLTVSFTMEIGAGGADRCTVEMADASGAVLAVKAVGRSSRALKTAEFSPEGSGGYTFTVRAARADETASKDSPPCAFDFSYPLAAPVVSALNMGGGALRVGWNAVREATSYEATCTPLSGDGTARSITAAGTETAFAGLEPGTKYSVRVTAVRNAERRASAEFTKTVGADPDRVWNFTWFGQSSRAETNTIEMLDADNLKFRLNSCSFDEKGNTELKGGKLTAFHDGISYYYTVIDPARENFELTATFTVDYINPVADGQEGFGLLAMDSLGKHGVSMVNHYTNSAGVIATKFEETVGGVKRTVKDAPGARFVSGLTDEVLALGDTGIAARGTSISRAFGYDQSELVKKGDVYTFTLRKTNTGYHAVYAKRYATGETVTEYVMYGTGKLLQLDRDHVYVGFAAARGCNVTVSGVTMKTTDPASDPPAVAEPARLVPLAFKIDSPSAYTEEAYPFDFIANADGKLSITTSRGRQILADQKILAGRDFTAVLRLDRGINDYQIRFAPDPDYRPGPGAVMAAWDADSKKYVPDPAPVTIAHTVILHSYAGASLYVSPDGSPFGKGTKASPLALETAINFAKPGQPIILAGGVYRPERGVTIERGNSGTEKARKVLKSAAGERAILDFGGAAAGMTVWGDRWTVEGIDVRNTAGNVKGLQVGGNGNIISSVNTYGCGDTGLQISGLGSEPSAKWPADNLVVDCTSYGNCDPARNNADGFAAKLTCGGGNVFRGCVAYSNIDDGWDLFSKIETGPIGAVLIENCVAYKNGSLPDGSGNGDGNGFKLGGDGIAVAHVLRNSVAFGNGASGITSNSDPAIEIENNTSFANAGPNINLYGKGDGARTFKARNNISMDGGSGDVYREMPGPASADNYFWNGAKSVNSRGEEIGKDIFVSVDPKTVPGRKADGSIDMKGFLVLNGKGPKGIGAAIR